MAIKIKCDGNVAVFTIRGKLMGGPETSEIKQRLEEMTGQDYRNFVFDLSGVKWMSSAGVGVMMACYAAVTRIDGNLGLARLSGKCRETLSHCRIIQLFDQFESIKTAIAFYQSLSTDLSEK